jgi:hypothetical protein
MRRSWAIMRRRFAQIWVDSDFEKLEDKKRLALLGQPFDKRQISGIKDFNLNKDRWKSVSTVYDMAFWKDRCFAAHKKSETLLREQSSLPMWSQQCMTQAERNASQVHQQYRSRIAMATGDIKTSLEFELAFEVDFLEAQLEAFRNPEVRIDSVGAVFLSNRIPFTTNNRNDEEED